MSSSVSRFWKAGVLFIAGLGLGMFLASDWLRASPEIERERIGVSGLTSPFLECAGERDADESLVHAGGHIEQYIHDLQASDATLHVSVYARELLDGHWIGIDEHRPMMPASLLKLWVLFHALARMESDPGLAAQTAVYPGPDAMPSPDNLFDRPPSERMTPGTAYRFDELVERMIVYSDNHAKDLLLRGVEPDEVEDFMSSVGLPKQVDHGRAVMDAHSIGALFRVLYDSSVFSRHTSEFALGLLLRGRYADGLRASLPPGIPVASKFGMYRDPAHPAAGSQMHECGIVYATNPYVLCVMTQSQRQSTPELSRIVREISRFVFEEGPAMSRDPH